MICVCVAPQGVCLCVLSGSNSDHWGRRGRPAPTRHKGVEAATDPSRRAARLRGRAGQAAGGTGGLGGRGRGDMGVGGGRVGGCPICTARGAALAGRLKKGKEEGFLLLIFQGKGAGVERNPANGVLEPQEQDAGVGRAGGAWH